MEMLVVGASTATHKIFRPQSLSISFNRLHPGLDLGHSLLQNGCSVSSSTSAGRKTSLCKIQAKKGSDNDKKKQKIDTHSFVARPDESGTFPEAVLLKPKKVQDDGQLMPEFADEEEKELFESLNLRLESGLNLERMRHYEVVYLIHQDHKDEVEKVNSKIQAFLKEKKGRLWRFSDWGMRRLAYKIQKATHAHYILINFEIEAKWINEFKTMLDQDERVIRHLVIKRDEAITKDCPPPPEIQTLRTEMDNEEEEYDDDDLEYDDEEYDEDEDEEEYDEDDEEYEEGEDEVDVQNSYDDTGAEDYDGNEKKAKEMDVTRKAVS